MKYDNQYTEIKIVAWT